MMIRKLILSSLIALAWTLAFSAGSAWAVPLNNPIIAGLVAAYEFSGNADDVSGNGNDGVVNGATPTADRFGNANSAYFFGGSQSIVSDVSSANFDTTNGVSLSAWMRVDSTSEQNHIVSGIGGTDSFYATLEANNQPTFRPQINWNNGITWQTGGATTSAIDWLHLVITWGGGSDVDAVDFFLDGTLYPSMITSNPGAVSPPFGVDQIFMGLRFGDEGAEGQPLNGALDDVYIYDRALSPSEVQTLYLVPEPSTALLLSIGLIGLSLRKKGRGF